MVATKTQTLPSRLVSPQENNNNAAKSDTAP